MTGIAVPIAPTNAAALRVDAQRAADAGADLVELRLDLAGAAGADARALLAAIGDCPLPVLATNRHPAEGGAWRGDERVRLDLLRTADATGAAWIDIEHRSLADLGDWRPVNARLILSWHDFEGPGTDHGERIAAMLAAGADVAKIAFTARDAGDLAGIEAAYRAGEPGRVLAIAMGAEGLASRLLAGRWGAPFTFARLGDGDDGSAPGQPTVADLRDRYRLRDQTPAWKVYGVVGDPVGHSLSPHIHNPALSEAGLDAVYVPLLVHDLEDFWRRCGGWIDGLSVTLPHKETLLDLGDEVAPLAARIGAANTLVREGERIAIANTDADAAIACLGGDGVRGRRAMVLGAGGVARALAWALRDHGAKVTIANRTARRAAHLAAEVGCDHVALDDAPGCPYDLLANGTSVGMNEDRSPWPASAHRADTTVFDTVYTPLETRLLRDAAAAGARTVTGLAMFVAQAEAQFRLWHGRPPPAGCMRRAAEAEVG